LKLKLLRLVARIYIFIDNLINFFKRSAEIHINYAWDMESHKVKDSFDIYVCKFNKCWMMNNIDWASANQVLNTLKIAKGKVILNKKFGGGTEYIIIPKWAKKSLIKQLEKELSEDGQ
jgi:hypothetical protein